MLLASKLYGLDSFLVKGGGYVYGVVDIANYLSPFMLFGCVLSTMAPLNIAILKTIGKMAIKNRSLSLTASFLHTLIIVTGGTIRLIVFDYLVTTSPPYHKA